MPQPFIGEIRMFAGNFEPVGWAFCNGQLLAIAQNNELYSLIGITYGGDGQTTFALPDLRGRCPLHQGNANPLGQAAGAETITLTTAQMPPHQHVINARNSPGTQTSPVGALPARDASASTYPYSSAAPANAMDAGLVSPAGGSQPHDNMPPFLAIHYIISLFGIFPTPT